MAAKLSVCYYHKCSLGLSIQIANQEGLIPRLEIIDSVKTKLCGIEEKIAFARDKFGVNS